VTEVIVRQASLWRDSPGLVVEADLILSSREPDLRRFPMLRHRFGAFEQLDNAMSVLVGRACPQARTGRTCNMSTHPADRAAALSDERVAA
jgi:hypothetical protein